MDASLVSRLDFTNAFLLVHKIYGLQVPGVNEL
jgi:hypothetical protein